MMLRIALVAVCLCGVAPAAAEHPIAGVISLLQDLEIQAKEEGATEQALFQKFTYWCKTSTKSLKKDIAAEKQLISELTDKIEGLKTGSTVLGNEIAELGKEIAKMTSAAANAKKIREDEVELYKKQQGNYGATIDAVDMAVHTMEEGEDGAALIQEQHHHQHHHGQHRKLAKAAPTKPDAKQYGFKSGNIIQTFEGMNTEFEGDKLTSEQAETNKQNAYNLAKQARDYAINTAKESKAEKESIKSDKESDKATATGNRDSENNALVSDSTSLDDTVKECTTKTAEWNGRTATRNGEIEALQVAQKILVKVTGVRNPDSHQIARKALIVDAARVRRDSQQFQQNTGFLALLQLDDPRTKAVNLLKQAAKTGHSKALQNLAEELQTYEGPFDNVNQMIQKMIFRLMAEQKDEDDHKNWCDVETEKNTEMKDDKTIKARSLKNSVESLQAAIGELTQKIAENTEKMAEIKGYQTTETDLRNENHQEIVATIKDSQDGQAALAQATAVLNDFYKSSGQTQKEPWEFLQIPDSPSTWDSSYSGVADPNSSDGILTLLDGVMQKFSKMEADSKAADETDQKNFDEDMAAKRVDLQTTDQDTQMKITKKSSLSEKMDQASADLKSTSSANDAVKQYLKDLEPACGTGDSSYGDRKAARSDEIEALRKAQTMLAEAFRAKGFLQTAKK